MMKFFRVMTFAVTPTIVGFCAGRVGQSGHIDQYAPFDITGCSSIVVNFPIEGWAEIRGPARHAVYEELSGREALPRDRGNDPITYIPGSIGSTGGDGGVIENPYK